MTEWIEGPRTVHGHHADGRRVAVQVGITDRGITIQHDDDEPVHLGLHPAVEYGLSLRHYIGILFDNRQ